MSDTDEGGTRSKAGASGGKTLSLKRTETSTVRQSFSHGRSKAVVVEKKRVRVMPGGKPLEPEKPVEARARRGSCGARGPRRRRTAGRPPRAAASCCAS